MNQATHPHAPRSILSNHANLLRPRSHIENKNKAASLCATAQALHLSAGASLALTRKAMALSLSVAGILERQGARRVPISSTRLTRAQSLAALCNRLACTCGVGARQGRTPVEAEDNPIERAEGSCKSERHVRPQGAEDDQWSPW